jgi:hypothetical protein
MAMGPEIVARLGYAAHMPVYPVSSAQDAENRGNLAWDWREVPIRSGRDIPGGATMATHGFTCVPHETAIRDFDPGMSWLPSYLGELTGLLKEMTGAAEVIVSHGRLGSTRMGGGNGTVSFCHNDYTAASAGRHVFELDAERAAERLKKRFAIYNIWRLVSPLPQNRPIAVCDATSITAADLMPGLTDWTFTYHQNSLFRYSPNHRWYYYPDLARDEVIVWAGYDSDPRFPSIVPHAAFDDPECTDPDARRVNVDCRAFIFYDA